MHVNKILFLALFSVAFNEAFIEKYDNQQYEYKNYVVTFENYGDKETQNIATWKFEDDTLITNGNWFEYLVKLKTKGWKVSRAMPGKWKGSKEITMVYYLEKLKEKGLE